MQKPRTIIIIATILIVCLLNSSCSVRRSEALTKRDFVPKNQRIANGEKLFMANCDKCHPAGESGLGPTLVGNPAPQLIFRFQMRHGLGVMPSFKKNEI